MARLTLPRIKRYNLWCGSTAAKTMEMTSYLRDVSGNPKGGEVEMARCIKAAATKITEARALLNSASSDLSEVEQALARRRK